MESVGEMEENNMVDIENQKVKYAERWESLCIIVIQQADGPSSRIAYSRCNYECKKAMR